MERKEIFEQIVPVLADQLNVDESEVRLESRFVDDLGADSLDLVEVVMALEEEFDVKIPDTELESLRTVADAIDYIEEHSE